MTIRFASAQAGKSQGLARALCHSAPVTAANDNACLVPPHPANDLLAEGSMVAEALRHFARHGLAAADHARANAEAASRSGDPAAQAWWMEICRTLDPRTARAASRAGLHGTLG